jgi:hypothetical protein
MVIPRSERAEIAAAQGQPSRPTAEAEQRARETADIAASRSRDAQMRRQGRAGTPSPRRHPGAEAASAPWRARPRNRWPRCRRGVRRSRSWSATAWVWLGAAVLGARDQFGDGVLGPERFSPPTGPTPSWPSGCWATWCTRCWCGLRHRGPDSKWHSQAQPGALVLLPVSPGPHCGSRAPTRSPIACGGRTGGTGRTRWSAARSPRRKRPGPRRRAAGTWAAQPVQRTDSPPGRSCAAH